MQTDAATQSDIAIALKTEVFTPGEVADGIRAALNSDLPIPDRMENASTALSILNMTTRSSLDTESFLSSAHLPPFDEIERTLAPLRAGMISPAELAHLMEHEDVRVIDVSSAEHFNQRHIAGGYEGQVVQGPEFWDFKLSESEGGIPEMIKHFRDYLGSRGITGEEYLVFTEHSYSEGLGQSCRGRFLARLAGYPSERTLVLNGGNEQWTAEQRPVQSGSVTPTAQPTEFPVTLREARSLAQETLATREDVARVVMGRDTRTVILDVRDFDEWTGDRGAPDPNDKETVPGRIPTSLNLFWADVFTTPASEQQTAGDVQPLIFKEPAALRELFEDIGLRQDTPVIVTCYKGARASVVATAMRETLGYENVKVYLESWHGYSRDERLPRETIEANGLPSSTRAFGDNQKWVNTLHFRSRTDPRRESNDLVVDGTPEGAAEAYESIDLEHIAGLKAQHAWITDPIYRASDSVRHSPFYRWASTIESPEAFKPAAVQLWYHSATFPNVMSLMLGLGPLRENQMMEFYSGHAFGESTHSDLLMDWMVGHKLLDSPEEVQKHIPSLQTNACVNLGYRLALEQDREKYLVAINCCIERLSHDFFIVLSERMHEIGAGHFYFDTHVEADAHHSIMGLEKVTPQDPTSARGRELIQVGLEGTSLWAGMLNSWIGLNHTPQFQLDGSIRRTNPLYLREERAEFRRRRHAAG